MESASDYFESDRTFREAVDVTYRDFFLGRNAWFGVVSTSMLALVAFLFVATSGSHFDAGVLLLSYFGTHSMVLSPRTRVHEVDESGVRVAREKWFGDEERTIPVEAMTGVELVEDDGLFASPGGNPFGSLDEDAMYWVSDEGVRIETGDGEVYVRSTRPEEFAAAVRELVDAVPTDAPTAEDPPAVGRRNRGVVRVVGDGSGEREVESSRN